MYLYKTCTLIVTGCIRKKTVMFERLAEIDSLWGFLDVFLCA